MKKHLSATFLIFWVLTLPFPTKAQRPSDVIDVIDYRFQIELNDTTDVIAGQADVTFVLKKDAQEFELDLVGKDAEGKGMTVAAVTLDDQTVRFVHENEKLRVHMPSPAKLNSRHTVRIAYKGIPADGLIIATNMFGDRTFFADHWPSRARNWLPVIDHPSDKATVSFAVVAPHHYEVIANGLRWEESWLDKDRKLTRYVEEVEISTKVMVIGVARFAMERSGTVDNIAVETWVYPQNRDEGFHDFALAVPVLEYFIEKIGPYPYRKLANVQSKTRFGGLENVNAIFYHERAVTGERRSEGLIAHEVAHQWFGNFATEKDWAHLWLSEGFATYMAHLYAEFRQGVEARRAAMLEDRQAVIEFSRNDRSPVVQTNDIDPMELLSPNSYQKPGWVLHMLRVELGDTVFWNVIREYYRRFGGRTATTDDFVAVVGDVSGKDLSAFFTQWLHQPGHPVLRVEDRYNSKTKTLELTVRQVQAGAAFAFPLEIGVASPDGRLAVETVYINKERETFSIPLAQKPARIELDPHVNLLFEQK